MTTAVQASDARDVEKKDVIQIRISEDEKRTWQAAAEVEQLSLSNWIRRRCAVSAKGDSKIDEDAIEQWLEAGRVLAEHDPGFFRQLLLLADTAAVNERLKGAIAEKEQARAKRRRRRS